MQTSQNKSRRAVLAYDPNPTTRDVLCGAIEAAGLRAMPVQDKIAAANLARAHGAEGTGDLVALILDASNDPKISEVILKEILRVPGTSQLAGILLVHPNAPEPIPSAAGLPIVARPFSREQLSHALTENIPQSAMTDASDTSDTSPPPPTDTPPGGLSCDLGLCPLVEVLRMLDRARVRGELAIQIDADQVIVTLDAGRILRARGDGSADGSLAGQGALAPYLEQTEGTTHAEMLRASKDGDLPAPALIEGVRAHTMDLLGALLSMDGQHATFTPIDDWDDPFDTWAATHRDGPAIPIATSVLLATKHATDFVTAGARLIDLEQVPVRMEMNVAKLRDELPEHALTILEHINGRSTIKEIARKTRMGALPVAKTIFQLTAAGAIEPRDAPTVA